MLVWKLDKVLTALGVKYTTMNLWCWASWVDYHNVTVNNYLSDKPKYLNSIYVSCETWLTVNNVGLCQQQACYFYWSWKSSIESRIIKSLTICLGKPFIKAWTSRQGGLKHWGWGGGGQETLLQSGQVKNWQRKLKQGLEPLPSSKS